MIQLFALLFQLNHPLPFAAVPMGPDQGFQTMEECDAYFKEPFLHEEWANMEVNKDAPIIRFQCQAPNTENI